MQVIIQKVNFVKILENVEIGKGLVVFTDIEKDDAAENVKWMASKILSLKVFKEWSCNIRTMKYEIYIANNVLEGKEICNEQLLKEFYEEMCKLYGEEYIKMGDNTNLEISNDGPFTIRLNK